MSGAQRPAPVLHQARHGVAERMSGVSPSTPSAPAAPHRLQQRTLGQGYRTVQSGAPVLHQRRAGRPHLHPGDRRHRPPHPPRRGRAPVLGRGQLAAHVPLVPQQEESRGDQREDRMRTNRMDGRGSNGSASLPTPHRLRRRNWRRRRTTTVIIAPRIALRGTLDASGGRRRDAARACPHQVTGTGGGLKKAAGQRAARPPGLRTFARRFSISRGVQSVGFVLCHVADRTARFVAGGANGA